MNTDKAKSKISESQRLFTKHGKEFFFSLGSMFKNLLLGLFHGIAVIGLTVLLAIHEARKRREEKEYEKKLSHQT